MKVQRVVKFVLVVALVIGVTGYVASVVAQTAPSTRAATIKVPPPPTKPNRVFTPPKVPAVKAGTAADPTSSLYRVSGQALRPNFSADEYDYIGMGGGCIYATDTDFIGEPFSAQIHLPQGAIINTLIMRYYRYDTSYNCTGYLRIYSLYGQLVTEYPIITGPFIGWDWGLPTYLSHTVNNNNYTYMMEWVPESAGSYMSLASFEIYVQDPPAAAPKVAVIPLY